MDDDRTTIKDSKTKHCAYVIRYTLYGVVSHFVTDLLYPNMADNYAVLVSHASTLGSRSVMDLLEYT